MENEFKIGDVIYEAISDDVGGVNILYHEVKGHAIINKDVKIQADDGDFVLHNQQVPAVNTSRMGNNEYRAEDEFFKFDDLVANVAKVINKRKLY